MQTNIVRLNLQGVKTLKKVCGCADNGRQVVTLAGVERDDPQFINVPFVYRVFE